MWLALPTSDYYEDSVPLPSHEMTMLLPFASASVSHEGDSRAVPTFTTHRLTGVGPSFSPCRLALGTPQPFPRASAPPQLDGAGVATLASQGRRRTVGQPISARFELVGLA
jgi:hypothetical protein